MQHVFRKWLNEIEREATIEVVWIFGPDSRALAGGDLASWLAFVNRAFQILGAKVAAGSLHTSYLWHDEQASQLRFATAETTRHTLPFGCKVVLADSPNAIVQAWLEDPGYIPLVELADADKEKEEAAEPEFELSVWAVEHRAR